MPEVEFIAGPYDGVRLSTGLGAVFLWTDGRRCYRAPALFGRRVLYRAMGDGARKYRFVGHVYCLCACGVYRAKRKSCAMCGAAGG